MNQSDGVMAGPALPRRTRRQRARIEWELLRRDGPVKYVQILRQLRRFNRSVERMRLEDRFDD